MKKLLSLFLCIPLFFISLLITHAEEIENNVEVILKMKLEMKLVLLP